MKKNYIQPNIKMAIAIETEQMIAVSLTVDNTTDNQITNSNQILSRRNNNTVWDDEDEE